MTDKGLNQQEQAGLTPGARLRQAREAAGLTHATVSEALHLTVHYIKSLENDEYHKLPGLIFVKGYIRSYGRYLKLDAESLLASYDRQLQSMPEVKSHTLAGNYTRKRNDQAILWAIAATLVILLGIGIGWWFFGRSQEPRTTTTVTPTVIRTAATTAEPANDASTAGDAASTDAKDQAATDAPAASTTAAEQPATPEPAPAPAATVTPAATGGRQINLVRDGSDQLQLSMAGNSWVEINDSQNARIYAEMLHGGDSLVLKGKAPFQLLLGDARNVKATFNAMPVDISVRNDSTARLTLGAQTVGVTR